MGLFDFVKEAGEKLLGRDKEAEAKQKEIEAKAAAGAAEMAERRLAGEIVRFVGGLGLDVTDLSVRVDGDKATVKGSVPDQATREKVVLAVGNTHGIARVDDQLTVEKPEPEATFYTVVRGDTLSGIAKKQYGNAGKYMVIFEANKPMLKDPDKIYPGQVLRIPPQA
jgi:nucleoid-associated protein YgaU